ncbi:tetratricopeptide repeat protein [Roseovarius ramblicola]|uniref:Tetratricopeptide repeat protein n=1 Tax=Roseovarius ramblicola TaxID=2022336 RepID=A0ABV5HZB3_9RHOB
MRRLTALPILCLLMPAGALACPDPPDHGAALDVLFEQVQRAETERDARLLNNEMWEIWADAPDAHAQDLLDEGMTRRASYDYDGAVAAFDALIDYCPDYAEGYNQRAFVNFIRQDYAAALPDLDRAVSLSPRHLGALTGQAMTLMALERPGEAALVLRRALDLNPWLTERHLLPMLEQAERDI